MIYAKQRALALQQLVDMPQQALPLKASSSRKRQRYTSQALLRYLQHNTAAVGQPQMINAEQRAL